MAIIVNGERIENEEIEHVRRQLELQQAESAGPPAEGLGDDPVAFAKDAAISRVLVKQAAMARLSEIPQSDIDAELAKIIEECGGEEAFEKQLTEVEGTREDIEKDIALRLKVDSLLDEVCKDVQPPTDEEVAAHYNEHKEWFMMPERVHAAHIVKHVGGTVLDMHSPREEMMAMRDMIRNGTPFEELARQNSDCPDNAGDLGWFARGAMVPEFEAVVFSLEPGAVSDVFESPFGLHIAKVFDKTPARPRPLSEVKQEVHDSLCRERENAVIDAYTDLLRAQADVVEE